MTAWAHCTALFGALVFGLSAAHAQAPAETTPNAPSADGPSNGASSDQRDSALEPTPEIDIPPPPEPPLLTPARVHFESTPDAVGVRYLADPLLEDSSGGGLSIRPTLASRYALLCETPCEQDLPLGHYGLLLSRGGEERIMHEPLGVDGATAVRIEWHDRSEARTIGHIILAIGLPAGAFAGLVPLAVELAQGDAGLGTAVGSAIGGVVIAAALSVGLTLALGDDGASFEAAPLPDTPDGLFSDAWR